jgi:hypothetical protein
MATGQARGCNPKIDAISADPLNVPQATGAACPRKDVPPKSITHRKLQIGPFVRHIPRQSLTTESDHGHR